MNKDILTFIEVRDGKIQKVSLELLGAARDLANVSGGQVVAGIIGDNLSSLIEELKTYDIDLIYSVDKPELVHYLTDTYANAFEKTIVHANPNVILLGATSIGRDLAPRLSARLKTGLTADCTKLEIDANGSLFMTRPAFGGNLFATIICPDHRPQMSTVRPGVMSRIGKNKGRSVNVIHLDVVFDKPRVEILEEIVETKEIANIEEAKILISIGRGIGSDENLQTAQYLAGLIKGTYSCSRSLVDCGRINPDRQVGQTGKTVRPELYLALGISGAVQHLAGMEQSDYIIAVNKDKTASIFSVADLGIVGDINQILPLLKEEIERNI
ncbi:MAG: electron transfer flavoprotein subunit alpha/FixB family protein [Bacteroidia bacterium]|nr:electron transfer flavoprotein subunit alpha/FixB family protein [Bacteroidia bacterium]